MVEVKLVFSKSFPAVQENKLHRYVRSSAFTGATMMVLINLTNIVNRGNVNIN